MDDLNAPAEPQQDELWLISYADLLSLLVGFFILIIAAVPMRQATFERIAASISGSKSAPLQQLRQRVEDLVEKSPELRDRVIARDDAEGLGIEFKDALLFDSGSADVRPEGRRRRGAAGGAGGGGRGRGARGGPGRRPAGGPARGRGGGGRPASMY